MDCQICKNTRPYCIHKSYHIERPKEIEKRVKEKLKKDFFGPSYSVFVGSFGYPQVNMGPLAGLEETANLDNPSSWFGMSYDQIIELRSMLIRSKQPENVFSRNKFVQENQELALASKTTEVELLFKKEPTYKFVLSDFLQPMGPTATLEKLRITENTKIDRKVEYIVKDDLKAAEASYLLYQNNQDVYKITTILSSGVLGKQENKKLVPSRWSITCVDDVIGKGLIENIKTYSQISNYLVFESSYMDNYFTVLLMPGSWEFENFEVWSPGSNWHFPTEGKIVEEHEPYDGRTTYANKQAGAYYCVRLAVLEYLERIKKQTKVVVFREVGDGYSVPLGVWVCRETVRNAMKQQPTHLGDLKSLLTHLSSKLRVDISDYIKISKILGRRKLTDYFTNP